MCGICGIYNFSADSYVDKDILKKMCSTLSHRGPDDEGFFLDSQIGLGCRRLSIIDLNTGKQPIHNEDESKWVVFNGEIYNFQAIRNELERRGHRFYTSTDTEVIVHSYEELGEDCVSLFNGMFAFALWDVDERKLLLARDRLGEKPLHYTVSNGRLLFASEIKCILRDPQVKRDVNFEALHDFLTFEWVPAPKTIFKDIWKLLPGHYLVAKKGVISIKQYWDVIFSDTVVDENMATRKLLELLTNSVRMRLISDVPLGALLSGGIDSSTVVGLMSKVSDESIKTFSIGFEEESYNELKFARIIADYFGTDHHEEILEPNIVDLISKVVSNLDEPFADVSSIPTYLVSEMARKYVKVCLSGDGGDELFAGYDHYLASRMYRYYRILPSPFRDKFIGPRLSRLPPTPQKKGIVNMVRRFFQGALLPEEGGHMRWMTCFSEAEKRLLYSHKIDKELVNLNSYKVVQAHYLRAQGKDQLSKEQYVDLKLYLQDDILVKVDRTSMANSLEVRVPYLDHNVVEFVASLHPCLRLRGFTRKYMLKKIASKLLPKQIVKRRKQGFSIPMKNWLRNELKETAHQILLDPRTHRNRYFDNAYIEKLVKQHLNRHYDHWHKLWALMCFKLWHRTYIQEERPIT